VLLLAAIPSTALAVSCLVVLAVFTAVSMTMVTTGFGATLATRQSTVAAAAPLLGWPASPSASGTPPRFGA